VLAAQQLSTAATLQSTALVLKESRALLGFGGLIFNRLPELQERIPAHFLGTSLEEAIQSVEQLLAKPIPFPPGRSVDGTYRELASLFQQKRPQIELTLSENLQKYKIPGRYFDEANFFFGNGLYAALALGDIAFLEADLRWIQRLFAGQEVPPARLLPYLAAYSQEVRKTMGKGLVSDWIDAYIARHKVAHHSTGNILGE
jgi:hypothetical protein